MSNSKLEPMNKTMKNFIIQLPVRHKDLLNMTNPNMTKEDTKLELLEMYDVLLHYSRRLMLDLDFMSDNELLLKEMTRGELFKPLDNSIILTLLQFSMDAIKHFSSLTHQLDLYKGHLIPFNIDLDNLYVTYTDS